MHRLIFALILGLAACGGPSIYDVEAACGADIKPFHKSWPCVRDGIENGAAYPHIKAYYVATGDVVAEKSREGLVTQSEANLIMAKAKIEATQATASASPVFCQRLGYLVACR